MQLHSRQRCWLVMLAGWLDGRREGFARRSSFFSIDDCLLSLSLQEVFSRHGTHCYSRISRH